MSLTPLRAIPCPLCKSEYLVGSDGLPECGLGDACELYAFGKKVLELTPMSEADFKAHLEVCPDCAKSYNLRNLVSPSPLAPPKPPQERPKAKKEGGFVGGVTV